MPDAFFGDVYQAYWGIYAMFADRIVHHIQDDPPDPGPVKNTGRSWPIEESLYS
jgi:hypothetical protein